MKIVVIILLIILMSPCIFGTERGGDLLIQNDKDRQVYIVLVWYLRYMPDRKERYKQPCYLAIIDYMNAQVGNDIPKSQAWSNFKKFCAGVGGITL